MVASVWDVNDGMCVAEMLCVEDNFIYLRFLPDDLFV